MDDNYIYLCRSKFSYLSHNKKAREPLGYYLEMLPFSKATAVRQKCDDDAGGMDAMKSGDR